MFRNFCFALLLFIPAAVMGAEPALDYSRLPGTFRGEVENGDGIYTVVTTFSLLSGGRIRGEYYVEGVVDPLKGYLTGARPEGNREVSFEWQDRDGEGYAVLQFSRDYSSFSGWWADHNSDRMHVWTGERTAVDD